jgi:hypothetical protein
MKLTRVEELKEKHLGKIGTTIFRIKKSEKDGK